jgi:hypothetical protein
VSLWSHLNQANFTTTIWYNKQCRNDFPQRQYRKTSATSSDSNMVLTP